MSEYTVMLEEVRRLRRDNERLTVEVVRLKHNAAIFAENYRRDMSRFTITADDIEAIVAAEAAEGER